MIVEHDHEAGAVYFSLDDRAAVDRTVHVSDLVMVDLDRQGRPVGVEFALPPTQLSWDVLEPLFAQFPSLKDTVGAVVHVA